MRSVKFVTRAGFPRLDAKPGGGGLSDRRWLLRRRLQTAAGALASCWRSGGVGLLATGVSSPMEGGKAPVDRVGRGFRVSERREFYGSGGIVLNTPDGVSAPAP
jgi:hypothetical protein